MDLCAKLVKDCWVRLVGPTYVFDTVEEALADERVAKRAALLRTGVQLTKSGEKEC